VHRLPAVIPLLDEAQAFTNGLLRQIDAEAMVTRQANHVEVLFREAEAQRTPGSDHLYRGRNCPRCGGGCTGDSDQVLITAV